jgi:proline-specific peptidase
MRPGLIVTLIAVGLASLGSMDCSSHGLAPGEGFVEVSGGRIWYRVVGSGPGTPLLLLHGGPGVPSLYLKPLEALSDERPVVFYDQLGSGQSDRPKDSSLWTVDRFVNEVGQVRKALGLTQIHLYGHSWGSMLAASYMLTRPSGVHSLVLASAPLSIPRYSRDARDLLTTIPEAARAAIETHERDGSFDSPEYQSAMMEFYRLYLARRQPWSAELQKAFAELNTDVYGYMQGPSEFTITGTIKDYDVTGRLKEISVPTLFTAGEYDEVRPDTVRLYQRLIPGSRLAVIENAAHLTMQDEPERYVQVLREFLRMVEGR